MTQNTKITRYTLKLIYEYIMCFLLVLGIDTFLGIGTFRYLISIPNSGIDTFRYLATIPILRIDTLRYLVSIPISGIDT